MPRKHSHQTALYRAGELSLHADSEVEQALQSELTRGLLGRTRAEIDGHVARTWITETQATADLAMDGAAALSAQEARYAQALPHAAARFSAIADAYTYICLDELRHLRRS